MINIITIIIAVLIVAILLMVIGIGSAYTEKEKANPEYTRIKAQRDELVAKLAELENEFNSKGLPEKDLAMLRTEIVGVKIIIRKVDYLLDNYLK